MERIKIFHIDAFTEKVFSGNPAAVCILDKWIDVDKMQKIASENNLAETAFVVKKDNDFEIKWFTPTIEVELCGHATLASAYVLFKYYDYQSEKINFFSSHSGLLSVEKNNEFLTLDFPTDIYKKTDIPNALSKAFDIKPIEVYKGKSDYLLIFSSQEEIENADPDLNMISTIDGRGVMISAKGNETDFVSRFFAPQSGIDEDPVTGSAHTTLTPYWSKKLNKKVLTAKQLSKRGGDLKCEYLGEHVKITGKAVTYLIGEIEI